MYTTLLTNLENGIFTITINRPDKMNALNATVFNELDAALDEVYTNAEIKTVIITGAGPKAFVAGADISEFGGLNKDQAMALARRGQDVFFKIENSRKPIVAAVNGFALGGGCELAMACHFRLCSAAGCADHVPETLSAFRRFRGLRRLCAGHAAGGKRDDADCRRAGFAHAGVLEQLTDDHSLVGELVRRHAIDCEYSVPGIISAAHTPALFRQWATTIYTPGLEITFEWSTRGEYDQAYAFLQRHDLRRTLHHSRTNQSGLAPRPNGVVLPLSGRRALSLQEKDYSFRVITIDGLCLQDLERDARLPEQYR